KKLIRTIVLSRAYQLSTQFDEKNFEADPDNVLHWRMPSRRLEAEALRDTMLALGGRLDLNPAKGSPVARGGEGNAGFRFRGPGGDRATSSWRARAVLVMTNRFVIRQAEGMAEKLLAGGDDDGARLRRAYQLCCARPPSEEEMRSAQKCLADYGRTKTGRSLH